VRRREFIAGLGAAVAVAAPSAVRPQQAGKIYRLGLLSGGTAVGLADERRKSLVDGLAARGFVDQKNLVLEQRWANGRAEQLHGLAAELKAAGVDAMITFGYPAALAAKEGAPGVPVVFTGTGDPVATGLVAGVSRPGGSLTGVTEISTELSAKRLEILKEVVPNLRQVAMLWNAADLGMTLRYRAAEDAARTLGLKVQTLGVREPDDFDHAFSEMLRDPPDAILMVSDALTNLNRKRIVDFAKAQRLPTIFEAGAIVRDGGLMSYGPLQSELGDRAADFVSRILRGARPGDLPLELPTRFELLINVATARTLGLVLSPSLMTRADEVVE
jgi:putative ABC transport system substrate-binding protein